MSLPREPPEGSRGSRRPPLRPPELRLEREPWRLAASYWSKWSAMMVGVRREEKRVLPGGVELLLTSLLRKYLSPPLRGGVVDWLGELGADWWMGVLFGADWCWLVDLSV